MEVHDDELIDSLRRQAKEAGIRNAAIVSLIGGADEFTISTMPSDDASADVLTTYQVPGEMMGTGEFVDGELHIHVVMGVSGDQALAGHLHSATIRTHFARAYVSTLD
jgi:predicted DNA-binding protein with PD1-like motif